MSMSLSEQARNVAASGRYGDTTLLHLNPIELRGIASLFPLTRNPQTGYAEAFLPLLALPALAAAGGGGAALGAGAIGAGALGAGAAGGALGAGALGAGAAGGLGAGALGAGGLSASLAPGAGAALAGSAPLGTTAFGAGVMEGTAAANFAGAGGGIGSLGTSTAGTAGTTGGAASGAYPAAAVQPGAVGGSPAPVATQAPSGLSPGAANVPIPSGGISSMLGNKGAMQLASAGIPALMSGIGGMGGGGGGPKKRKSRPYDRKSVDREYTPGPASPTGRERRNFSPTKYVPYAHGGMVRGYAHGGLVHGYADGGIASLGGGQPAPPEGPQDQAILSGAIQAIRGSHPEPKVAIQAFIQRFGPEAFEALMQREMSAQESTGTSDSIPAVNPDGAPAALSEGEYVVPADVVSGLGEGSTNAGGRSLDGMVQSMRGPTGQIDPQQMPMMPR